MQLHGYAHRRRRRGLRLLRPRAHPHRRPPPAPARSRRSTPTAGPTSPPARDFPSPARPRRCATCRRRRRPTLSGRRGLPGHAGRGLARARPGAARPGRRGRGPLGRLPAPRPGRLSRLVRLRAHRVPLLAEARYGLPELDRAALRGATFVTNPGCYATAIALALSPLVRSGPGRARGDRRRRHERRLRRRPQVERGVLLLRGGRGPARLPDRPPPARPGDRADRGALRRRGRAHLLHAPPRPPPARHPGHLHAAGGAGRHRGRPARGATRRPTAPSPSSGSSRPDGWR